jgi:hypothetical protein
MAHPLEDVMRQSEGFVLIGDSSEGRFPAQSFHCYSTAGVRFYCLDLGGLRESRGASKGKKIYGSVEELPADRSDLAIVWMKPKSAKRGVELAHQAGCKRIWFSFMTGHPEAVAHARELGLEVVEIGRCPVHYIEKQVPACRAHTVLLQITGSYRKPPQTDPSARRRELV